ncbi:hypothetical protein N7481_006057 [Penicillium waksmanii]|uniref:uncharacterized protein n=1 Tax=Penicillium waksmanii TaxID=69791 RepID=UPI0025485FAF|nr:uncharacterized protein N7481_006057 [Penicillium waksmanii]KAJ5983958.1 hypothetical protein N7481_006057 [Penicillium waksmanii]
MLLESFSSLKGLSPSQYIFGIQAIPLVASGVYTLFWPSAAAALPNSPLKDISNGTIQAIRLLAAFVFYRAGGGWCDVAPFEGVMGLLTAGGIYWDWIGPNRVN